MAALYESRPEIWLRPSPRLSLDVLLALIEAGSLTATPRLGVRDGTHAKGYSPGDTATLRVLDEKDQEQLRKRVRICSLITRQLSALTEKDLEFAFPYKRWEDVQADLSFFEGRDVNDQEDATIVTFTYV
jgi:hypothetical protein